MAVIWQEWLPVSLLAVHKAAALSTVECYLTGLSLLGFPRCCWRIRPGELWDRSKSACTSNTARPRGSPEAGQRSTQRQQLAHRCSSLFYIATMTSWRLDRVQVGIRMGHLVVHRRIVACVPGISRARSCPCVALFVILGITRVSLSNFVLRN